LLRSIKGRFGASQLVKPEVLASGQNSPDSDTVAREITLVKK